MTISVVIPHFFVERQSNLPIIVSALMCGSMPPNEIVIWNNDAPLDTVVPGAHVVQSARNIGCKARFLAALTCRNDYVLFHDNDVAVRSETLAHLREYADERTITTLEGRRLIRGRPYSESIEIYGTIVSAAVDVDISLGRLELVHRQLVNSMVADIPFDDSTVMDDVWFSAAAAKRRIPRRVIPCRAEQAFTNLPHHGVGSCVVNPAEHYRQRDELCAKLFGNLTASADVVDAARFVRQGRYVASADQVPCDVNDHAAILNLKNGMYFGLDEVAARIWCLLESPKTVDELKAVLSAEYDVEGERLDADICRLLDEFVERGLVDLSS